MKQVPQSLQGKRILMRVDYNVPLKNGKVEDNSKIKASLATVKILLREKCKIIILTHLGRPKGRIVSSLSVSPILKELKKLMPKEKISKTDDCIGKKVKEKIAKMKDKEILILENLRFYKEEKENDTAFAHSLASLGDIYINDAFAVSHRKQASVAAITKFLPSFPGEQMKKEVRELDKALHPRRPSIWIMGGAKLDKVNLLQQAFQKADYILMGGALPFPFLKAQGMSIGMSKSDGDSEKIAKKILKKRHAKKLIFPVDYVVADKFSHKAKTKIVAHNEINGDQIALDLGPETIKLFKKYLRKASTIVWNGPLGYFEWVKFSNSTKEIGRFIGHLTATTIVGGGETSEAIKKFHLTHKMDHVSTGGGASLSFLSGEKLPGLEALKKN